MSFLATVNKAKTKLHGKKIALDSRADLCYATVLSVLSHVWAQPCVTVWKFCCWFWTFKIKGSVPLPTSRVDEKFLFSLLALALTEKSWLHHRHMRTYAGRYRRAVRRFTTTRTHFSRSSRSTLASSTTSLAWSLWFHGMIHASLWLDDMVYAFSWLCGMIHASSWLHDTVYASLWLHGMIHASSWLHDMVYASSWLYGMIHASSWLHDMIYASLWLHDMVYALLWLHVVVHASLWDRLPL